MEKIATSSSAAAVACSARRSQTERTVRDDTSHAKIWWVDAGIQFREAAASGDVQTANQRMLQIITDCQRVAAEGQSAVHISSCTWTTLSLIEEAIREGYGISEETLHSFLSAMGSGPSAEQHWGMMWLHTAAAEGWVNVVRRLVQSGVDVGELAADGSCALHKAAQQGHVECVRELLSSGSEREAVNCFGNTPALLAAAGGHAEVLEALHLRGARIDDETRNSQGDSLLQCASSRGHLGAVRTLLHLGANRNARPISSRVTALHTAILHGHASSELVDVLMPDDFDFEDWEVLLDGCGTRRLNRDSNAAPDQSALPFIKLIDKTFSRGPDTTDRPALSSPKQSRTSTWSKFSKKQKESLTARFEQLPVPGAREHFARRRREEQEQEQWAADAAMAALLAEEQSAAAAATQGRAKKRGPRGAGPGGGRGAAALDRASPGSSSTSSPSQPSPSASSPTQPLPHATAAPAIDIPHPPRPDPAAFSAACVQSRSPDDESCSGGLPSDRTTTSATPTTSEEPGSPLRGAGPLPGSSRGEEATIGRSSADSWREGQVPPSDLGAAAEELRQAMEARDAERLSAAIEGYAGAGKGGEAGQAAGDAAGAEVLGRARALRKQLKEKDRKVAQRRRRWVAALSVLRGAARAPADGGGAAGPALRAAELAGAIRVVEAQERAGEAGEQAGEVQQALECARRHLVRLTLQEKEAAARPAGESSGRMVTRRGSSDNASDVEEKEQCVVCLTEPRQSIIIPCGHYCLCASCEKAYRKQSSPKCPICRRDVERFMRVFNA